MLLIMLGQIPLKAVSGMYCQPSPFLSSQVAAKLVYIDHLLGGATRIGWYIIHDRRCQIAASVAQPC